jgi:hypothetical protein
MPGSAPVAALRHQIASLRRSGDRGAFDLMPSPVGGQLAGESFLQQGLFELRQGDQFLLVDGFEALRLNLKLLNIGSNTSLFRQRRNWHLDASYKINIQIPYS